METVTSYNVLLYYKFISIDEPETVREEHYKFCESLELRGRILIAPEGINGTVSGLKKSTDAYIDYMNNHPLFRDIEFKIDEHDQHAFHKLHVRVKPELVNFGDEYTEFGAPYIEPDELLELLETNPENIILVDTRSDYEFNVGKFRNAITLNIHNFRDINDYLDIFEKYQDKKIVTYCTGGIRCEKLTPLLKRKGLKNIYQLHGGIIRYAKETGGKYFDGQCYVFDERVAVPVNTVNPVVIGKCHVCQAPTESFINCANADCNNHLLICTNCQEKLHGCCSEKCMNSPKCRSWNGKGMYFRGENSKSYKATKC